jgi:hypothetical protein
MTIMYSNDDPPPLAVETVLKGTDFFDPDDESLGDKTEASASEYKGDLKEMPFKMFFGDKECRVKFTQPVDKKAFICVRGNKYGVCERVGHNVIQESGRAKEVVYETARTVKYLYGKLDTYQSKEERGAELLKEKAACKKGLLEAASFLQGSGTSPSG